MAYDFPIGEDDVFDFDPRNLPASYRKAIGLVAASSAQTEAVMQYAICAFLGVDAEYGWAVTAHMNATMRDQVLRATAEIRIDDLDALDQLDDLMERIGTANGKRNGHVHAEWCRDPKTDNVYAATIKARGRVESSLVKVAVDEIEADAKLIYDLGIELMNFVHAMGLEAPLPPPIRPRGHKSKAARKQRRKSMGK